MLRVFMGWIWGTEPIDFFYNFIVPINYLKLHKYNNAIAMHYFINKCILFMRSDMW